MNPQRSCHAGLLAAALLAPACFTGADGREPTGDELYFPTGLAVSPGRTTLYAASSDFDLRYTGGAVHAIDLAGLRGAVRPITTEFEAGASVIAACAAAGLGPNEDAWLYPGPCAPFELPPLVRSAAFIGAFASGILLTHDPDSARARLFVPVRGDPSITYFDVDDDRAGAPTGFRLDCSADDTGHCDAAYRIGQDPEHSLRGLQLPADPGGIAASEDGHAIVSAHQTDRAISLLINDWTDRPWLAYFASQLPASPMELASVPMPALSTAVPSSTFAYESGFAMTYRGAAEVDLFRFNPDSGAVPPRPFVQRVAATAVTTNASGLDSRGIAIVDDERRACEATCASGEVDCLRSCAENVALRVFIANRTPPSLLIGRLETHVTTTNGTPTSAFDTMSFSDSVPLAAGASRVRTGRVIDESGNLRTRVVAVCFDSRLLFSYDPELERVDAVIRTGRGPHDIAFDWGDGPDGPYAYLYVAHFTDSYIGVVDLDMRHASTFGQMFATVGIPRPPEDSN